MTVKILQNPDSKDKQRPVCTIRLCNRTPVTQHLYRCESCHFEPTETICEACAKFCHVNHKIIDLGYHLGYCHCGYGCEHCHCFLENPVEGDDDIPSDIPRQCTCRVSGNTYIEMQTYKCENCGITGRFVCCPSCHALCHRGHFGSDEPPRRSISAFCDCGDTRQNFHCKIQPPETIPPPLPLCTYCITGSTPVAQKLYICHTCDPTSQNLICEACIRKCHADHRVSATSDEGYCRCGSGDLNCPCILMGMIEPAQ